MACYSHGRHSDSMQAIFQCYIRQNWRGLTCDLAPFIEHGGADPRGVDESDGEHGDPPRLPQLGEELDVVRVVVVGKVHDPGVRRPAISSPSIHAFSRFEYS